MCATQAQHRELAVGLELQSPRAGLRQGHNQIDQTQKRCRVIKSLLFSPLMSLSATPCPRPRSDGNGYGYAGGGGGTGVEVRRRARALRQS